MLKNKNEVQMKLSFMAITLIFIPTLVLSEDKKIAARIDKLIEHQPIFTAKEGEDGIYLKTRGDVTNSELKGVSIEDNLYQYTPQNDGDYNHREEKILSYQIKENDESGYDFTQISMENNQENPFHYSRFRIDSNGKVFNIINCDFKYGCLDLDQKNCKKYLLIQKNIGDKLGDECEPIFREARQ